MKIIFIGSGNLAVNLAKALYRAGHEILQVFSRTAEHADSFAALFECSSTTCIYDVRPDADIYIFSLKDSVLERMANCVAENVQGKLFVHTAGSMPLDVLPVKRRGVLYPMQTFSKSREVDFSIIPTFIEAENDDDLILLKELAESISHSVYELDSERRRYLHLSAVFCCNFVNHCYRLSERILKPCDIPFDVMLPLIDETARKVHELSPSEAQTGPAIRWDENVIRKHLDLLDEMPDLHQLYELLSKSIHNDKQ